MIGSPRGTVDSYGEREELRRTGKVYITEFDGTQDLIYLQTLSPQSNVIHYNGLFLRLF